MSGTMETDGKEMLLQDYYRRIDNAINDYIHLDKFSEVLDLTSASIQQFHACMQFVANNVFVIRSDGRRGRNKIDYSDIELLKGLLDYYIFLCNTYNKVPSITGFSYYIGYSVNTLYDMRDMMHYSNKAGHDVGYSGIDENIIQVRSRLLKSINKLHELTLLDRLSNNSNPVGMIAAGNVVHNWDNRRAVNVQDTQRIESSVISAKYLLPNNETAQIVQDPDTIPDFTDNDLQ